MIYDLPIRLLAADRAIDRFYMLLDIVTLF